MRRVVRRLPVERRYRSVVTSEKIPLCGHIVEDNLIAGSVRSSQERSSEKTLF